MILRNQALTLLSALLLLASCGTTKTTASGGKGSTEAMEALKNFPKAKLGYERYVIYLKPMAENENDYKVEIIPGKTMQVDCNQHGLQGTISEKIVSGFGYNYYEFKSEGRTFSTLMGCPDNKLTEQFVSGDTKMMQYNSRLPIVIYVPKGFGVQYKVWKAGAAIQAQQN